MDDVFAIQSDAILTAKRVGVWTWLPAHDLILGNLRLAEILGLDPAGVEVGLPLNAYLECIHLEDRSLVCDALSTSMSEMNFFSVLFRSIQHNQERQVYAFGHYSRYDHARSSQVHEGILVDVSGLLGSGDTFIDQLHVDLQLLAHHCHAMNLLALRNGFSGIARASVFILEEVRQRLEMRLQS